jgi:iron complex outermembrane receptor protein
MSINFCANPKLISDKKMNCKIYCDSGDKQIMINHKIAKTVRLALTFGAVSTMALTSSMAFAQDDAQSKAEEKEERIAVTGSRIARSELSQPTPILTLDAKDIARFGTPDLGSILAELPAIGATDTLVGNNGANSDAGLSSADLRRLGAKRTLVLINGKRHVAGSPGSMQVDLSTIPAALIERIEIITGGASAIYGSDAVTGVINVILKENYEGVELSTTGSQSLEGVGAGNFTFNFVAGTDLSDGRGNFTFFAGLDRIEQTMAKDIRQFDHWSVVNNPLDNGEDDGIPDKLRARLVGSEMIHANGVLNPFSSDRLVFDANGNHMAQCVRENTNSFAFGSFPNGCSTAFYGEDYNNHLPKVDRFTIGSTFNFDINEDMQFVSDFKYTKADVIQQFQPIFRFGNISINVADNAYLSDDLRAELGGEGAVPMAKFFDELGNRFAENERELFRFTGGIEGAMSFSQTDVDYELFYVYGETSNERITHNDLIEDNLVAAIDSVIDPATGQAVCRSQLPSAQGDDYTNPASVDAGNCQAYNPFGFAQSTQAARDWVSADTSREDSITQEVIGGSLATDFGEWFELPGGPVGFSAGFEYRKEEYKLVTDALTKSGVLAGAATPNEFGKYDVSEGFVEFSAPILADMTGVHELTIDAAYRYAEYSHAGIAKAWKLGLMYAPIEDVRFRATHGFAVRAPNLLEAFQPLSPGFSRVEDPCDGDNINETSDRAANCAALGIPVGFVANDNVSINTISGGNLDLISEESTSTTVGFMWTPSFVKNFSLTVDFYDIEIKDAIIAVKPQNIADNCVDAIGSPDSNFCNSVDRDPVTHDITLVRSGFLNAASLKITGIETEVRYSMPLEIFSIKGNLHSTLFISKLLDFDRFEFQDRPDVINLEKGEEGDPELQLRMSTTYDMDDLSLNWTMRYLDRVVTYDVSPENGGSPEDLYPGWIPSITTHDLSAAYYLTDGIQLSLGVRNVFDKIPPGYTSDASYDLIGRRAFVGMKISFE